MIRFDPYANVEIPIGDEMEEYEEDEEEGDEEWNS